MELFVELLFLMKVNFFFPQIVQLDKTINLFCLVFLTLEFSFTVFFYNLHNTFPLLFIISQYFLTINFIAFDLIILFDLNSNPNNLVEILFTRALLVDCLMCLNILLMVLKISKSLSGWILINSQPSSYSIVFLLFIW